MPLLRIDAYGGYANETKPDPDHCYKWEQYDFETAQDFKERVQGHVSDIIDQLDEDNEYDD